MSIEGGIERLAALVLLLTCLSHIAMPAVWHDLFSRIRQQGNLAGLAVAAIHLPLALLIVAFHNVWSWPSVVVTLTGWALLLKGSLHLVSPRLTRRSLAIPGEGEKAVHRYRLSGLAMLPFVALLGWIALR